MKSKGKIRWIAEIAVIGISVWIFSPKQASRGFEEVAAKSVPKSVEIQVFGLMEQTILIFDEKGIHQQTAVRPVMVTGAGVFISPNNHVLTCAHLFWFKEIKSMVITDSEGNSTAGELLFKRDDRDLALVRTFFDEPTSYAHLIDPRKLRVGQEVIAVGTPLGFEFTVTHGIISALYRDQVGYNMTQSDTSLNPGNSGGPLFNLDGDLVGINSRIVPPVNAPVFTGLGFSVSPAQIREFLTLFKGLDKTL